MTCEWYLFECPSCSARTVGRLTLTQPLDDFARCRRCREIYPALGESVDVVEYASRDDLEGALAHGRYTDGTETALRLAVWRARNRARLAAIGRNRLAASINVMFAIALFTVGGALLLRGAPWFAMWEFVLGALFAWITVRGRPPRARLHAAQRPNALFSYRVPKDHHDLERLGELLGDDDVELPPEASRQFGRFAEAVASDTARSIAREARPRNPLLRW